MKTLITVREQEILRLMAQGMSSKTIADVLNLSFHTVQTQRKNILRKLNENRTIRAMATHVGIIPVNKMQTSLCSMPE